MRPGDRSIARAGAHQRAREGKHPVIRYSPAHARFSSGQDAVPDPVPAGQGRSVWRGPPFPRTALGLSPCKRARARSMWSMWLSGLAGGVGRIEGHPHTARGVSFLIRDVDGTLLPANILEPVGESPVASSPVATVLAESSEHGEPSHRRPGTRAEIRESRLISTWTSSMPHG